MTAEPGRPPASAVADATSHPGGWSRALAPWRRLAPWQIATLLAATLYLPWLGQRSLWYPDEPDVAEPAITMHRSGDWVVPRQNDDAWLDYPPLVYWLGAASGGLLGGTTPYALRFPVALLALLLVALSTRFAAAVAGREVALWTGLTLATAPFFVWQAVNYHPDMGFATLISCGLGAYAWASRAHRFAALWKVTAFACFGGAVLAKGPLGLLLPGLILVVWLASLRQWKSILWLAPLSLVALAVALPWYVVLAAETSREFVWGEIYAQNFARFSASERGHQQPWSYYLIHIWFNWLPWSLLLPAALAAAVRRGWRDPFIRLAVLWLSVSVLFLSAAETKRDVYLLIAYPAIAFLIGRAIAARLGGAAGEGTDGGPETQGRWFVAACGALALATAIALPTLAFYGSAKVAYAVERLPGLWPPLAVLCAGLGVGGLVLLRQSARGVSVRSLASVVAVLWFSFTITFAGLQPRFDALKSYRAVGEWLRRESGDRPLGFLVTDIAHKRAAFRVEDPEFMPLVLLETPAEAARFLFAGGVVILHPDRSADLAAEDPEWSSRRSRTVRIGTQAFVFVGFEGREDST